MVSISGKGADAIGKEVAAASQAGRGSTAEGPADLEKLVWDQLKTCFNPEIPQDLSPGEALISKFPELAKGMQEGH